MNSLSAGPQSLVIEAAGEKWQIKRAGDLEELWNGMTGNNPDDEDHIPYWTEVWPASMLLMEHISSQKKALAGTWCLDVGCGLGLTALVGKRAGARVMAMDLEYEALGFARQNGRINGVQELDLIQADWRQPPFKAGGFDYIWAADVLYESRFAQPLVRLLTLCLKKDGRIWIADPQRNISKAVWSIFINSGFKLKEIRKDRVGIGPHRAEVRLMELVFDQF
ncbi:class I SAM-dependent methyltransferase [Desulfonatronovibrio hydrogenovorans]|uniref:class I SAM-dependent methyltransferase n=1 Tax=Desulfonatronovibrio hydrogenovorans TaxID=53245 RepID=UPI00068DD4EF|nr:class I SAM-dependent methyltransferase [Desulfonatronovibrio hydrogenovorans]